MLIDELKNIKSTKKDLINFGLVVGGVLAAIGIVLFLRDRETYTWFAGIGTALIICGLIVPAILKPLYLPWMGMAVVLGFVVTHILLFTLYVTVIMPIGLVSRALGKKFMQPEKSQLTPGSYWIRREGELDPNRCTKLF